MNRGELYRAYKPDLEPGLKHPSWIMCDNLVSLRKTDLTNYVGSLSPGRLIELKRALKMALDLCCRFHGWTDDAIVTVLQIVEAML
jgi:mRNA-degrading endonuclease toxin of MazEF toxin-antitoxin module